MEGFIKHLLGEWRSYKFCYKFVLQFFAGLVRFSFPIQQIFKKPCGKELSAGSFESWREGDLFRKKINLLANSFVIPLKSNAFSNWRRTFHLSWIKNPLHFVPL